MVYDLELVAGAFGVDEGFTQIILDDDGNPDDLTSYAVVRLVISDIFYTPPPTRNHTQSDTELTVDALGNLTYSPTNTNPVPAFGKYYVQIYRESTTTRNKPVRKLSLLVTEGVPKS